MPCCSDVLNMVMLASAVCSDDDWFVLGCTHTLGYCPLIHLYLVAIMDLVLRTDICGALIGACPSLAFMCGDAMTMTLFELIPLNPIGVTPRKGVLTDEFRADFPM